MQAVERIASLHSSAEEDGHVPNAGAPRLDVTARVPQTRDIPLTHRSLPWL